MSAAVAFLRRQTNALDLPVVALIVLIGVLALFLPVQAVESAWFVTKNLAAIAPFLLLSVAVAAYAAASGADNLIAKAFQGRTVQMVFVAALFGALSPFCSCGVIPLIAALLAIGVPLAPVMAFWLASPIMDPSMFVLTAGVLGAGFAIAKTAAAFGLGLAGGFGIWGLTRLGLIDNPLRPGIGDGGCAGSRVRTPQPVVWRFWQEAARVERFGRSGLSTLVFLGKWLALAFLLESLMLAYIPADMIAGLLGGGDLVSLGLATVLGIPAYLNGYAALPLVAALIEQGMAPGAGMAFLVAGGVTSIPAAIAVFALARLPVFFAYVSFALVGAFLSGLLYGIAA